MVASGARRAAGLVSELATIRELPRSVNMSAFPVTCWLTASKDRKRMKTVRLRLKSVSD